MIRRGEPLLLLGAAAAALAGGVLAVAVLATSGRVNVPLVATLVVAVAVGGVLAAAFLPERDAGREQPRVSAPWPQQRDDGRGPGGPSAHQAGPRQAVP